VGVAKVAKLDTIDPEYEEERRVKKKKYTECFIVYYPSSRVPLIEEESTAYSRHKEQREAVTRSCGRDIETRRLKRKEDPEATTTTRLLKS
jgi:hypothetical protein